MNSNDDFHVDIEMENEEFDFFDPTDFAVDTKLFSKDGEKKPTELETGETSTSNFLATLNQKPVEQEEFNFSFSPNESLDDEIQIVPDEKIATCVATQPSGEVKKNQTFGGHRSSQTAGTSRDFPIINKTEVNEPNSTPSDSCAEVPVAYTSGTKWKPDILMAEEGAPLESLNRIPMQYRDIFTGYDSFNVLQSLAFNVVFTTDRPVVISAPTSSGKTVIFELAILRLLLNCKNAKRETRKILYMAPTKAVVNEKFRDWDSKFSRFGIKCLEVTGDSEIEDYKVIERATLVFTTPEKWDSLTRNAEGISQVVDALSLILIDEVHCLNDNGRGATMEVVISRMKTINRKRQSNKMRFIAVSATIPNAEDIALWLGTYETQSVVCILPSDMRPVKLENIVVGYRSADSENNFQFEKRLSYRVPEIIETYSDGKPTLVFVPTRNSTISTAQQIIKSQSFVRNAQQKRDLIALSHNIKDLNLKNLVVCGIGFHHAGLSCDDRNFILDAFLTGRILVLCCTTTLALGVNVPAHLVIIKSTFLYMAGVCIDLPESQVLQMIGRAGRPQFDTSAIAVIMTKEKLKSKYEKMLSGTQVIESFLHKHLAEHINAEIVLKTITDVTVACEWIHSTFLYIRILKNKTYYGIDVSLGEEAIEKKLQQWCIKELNGLKKYKLISMDEDFAGVSPTETGKIMARYCVSLASMKKFMKLKGRDGVKEILEMVSSCEEVTQEMRLRNPERNQLNSFNETSKHEPNKELIKYQLKGKIKNPDMKANCLIQAVLGNMKIDDYSLFQDAKRVLKSGQRVAKCLSEYLLTQATGFTILVNGLLLAKCFRAGIWEDSPFVTRQLMIQSKEVSVTVSRDIAAGGLTSFEAIESSLPQIVEMFAKKQQPYGKLLQASVRRVPRYEVSMDQVTNEIENDDGDYFVTLRVKVVLSNLDSVKQDFDRKHSVVLIIGNFDDELLHKERIYDRIMVQNNGKYERDVKCLPSRVANKVLARLISESISGIDVYRDFYPTFDEDKVKKYFANPSGRINLPSDPNIPRQLQFFSNWKHLCNRGNCGDNQSENGKEDNVCLSVNKVVPSVKRKTCQSGPMDRFVDNRQPVKEEYEEMMSDPEFDELLANFNFSNVNTDDEMNYNKTETNIAPEVQAEDTSEAAESEGPQKVKPDDDLDDTLRKFEETKENDSLLTDKLPSKQCQKNESQRKGKTVTKCTKSNWEQYEELYRKRTQSTNYGTYSSAKKFRSNRRSSSQKERTTTSFHF